MELHLKIVGILLILLSALHIFFPGYFKWKEDLKGLSLINRQMMYVHAFFIGLVVFGIGILSFFFSEELIQTKLGRLVCLGLAVFWGIRLIVQLVVYSTALWRGKRFETSMHILFTGIWTYLTIIFLWVYLKA